jgi:hypothetical protein
MRSLARRSAEPCLACLPALGCKMIWVEEHQVSKLFDSDAC